MAGGYLPFGLAPSGDLTTYQPTLRERATDWLRTKLFTDDRKGQEKAGRVMDVAEIPFGFATDLYDAGREGAQGNYGGAALTLGMAGLPGPSLPPLKNAQKTQIVGTLPTYIKASKILENIAPGGKAIDFGAGLGMSRDLGFQTFEPFPREGFVPDFTVASEVPSDAYRRLTNLNVLNVVPNDVRNSIVEDIARVLEPGGYGVITTRGRDVLNAKGVPGPEPLSIITSANTYQKGFSPQELNDYLRRILGDKFDVQKLNLGPAGALINKKNSKLYSVPSPFGLDVPGPSPKGIRAYHGSPHDFDRFDMSKIGTGEGAQAYGHGLYFAENEGVARSYKAAGQPSYLGADRIQAAQKILEEAGGDRGAALALADQQMRTTTNYGEGKLWQDVVNNFDDLTARTPGSMYEVQINADPESFLDWDKPLSADAPQPVKDAFNRVANSDPALREQFHKAFRENQPGNIYYSILNDHAKTGDLVKNQTFATEKLREAGIPGIKYLDAGSRGAGAGTRNYVVFDDKLVSIVRKYGIAGASAMLGYNILDGMDEAQAAELKRIEGNQ